MRLKNAVVIGGSIAGMLAARVLADRFESVTIVETDQLPLQPEVRKGVAQSPQPHVLLTRGYRILEELFPGIGSEMSAAGAISIDWVREFHSFVQGKWSLSDVAPSDIVSFTCSRPLLEWAIRQRLMEIPKVQFVEKHRVIGLLTNGTQVTGVRMQAIAGDSVDVPANLVVDAAGRRSHTPQWLESLGFDSPKETVVNPFLGYATRRYKQPEGFTDDWKVMLISQEPPDNKRLGYLAKIEGGEWIATLGGYGHDFPPLDNEGFLEFARSLSSPKFYETIKEAEPVSPIIAHRVTVNRLRHYEKTQMPQGLIALGDAVCAVCPVYGQGMSASALSAMVLKDWLSHGTLNSSRFQKSLATSNSFHWTLATEMDSRFLSTSGRIIKSPNLIGKVFAWYNQQVIASASFDSHLHTLYLEITQFLKSPLAFYHPQVIFRVLKLLALHRKNTDKINRQDEGSALGGSADVKKKKGNLILGRE